MRMTISKYFYSVCIIFLLIQSSIIFSALGNQFNDMNGENASQSSFLGKADLIIEKIIIEPGHFPGEKVFYCIIRNVGDKTIYDVDAKIILQKYILGIIPYKVFETYHRSRTISAGLQPNQTTSLPITSDDELPKFGWYVFKCEVNPDHAIEEWNYSNNFYNGKYFVFFGRWFAR